MDMPKIEGTLQHTIDNEKEFNLHECSKFQPLATLGKKQEKVQSLKLSSSNSVHRKKKILKIPGFIGRGHARIYILLFCCTYMIHGKPFGLGARCAQIDGLLHNALLKARGILCKVDRLTKKSNLSVDQGVITSGLGKDQQLTQFEWVFGHFSAPLPWLGSLSSRPSPGPA